MFKEEFLFKKAFLGCIKLLFFLNYFCYTYIRKGDWELERD